MNNADISSNTPLVRTIVVLNDCLLLSIIKITKYHRHLHFHNKTTIRRYYLILYKYEMKMIWFPFCFRYFIIVKNKKNKNPIRFKCPPWITIRILDRIITYRRAHGCSRMFFHHQTPAADRTDITCNLFCLEIRTVTIETSARICLRVKQNGWCRWRGK